MDLSVLLLVAGMAVAIAVLGAVLLRRGSGEPAATRESALVRERVQGLESQLREEMGRSRQEISTRLAEQAGQQTRELQGFGELLNGISRNLYQRLEDLRETVERQLKDLQSDNSDKLDKMRATVEEQLQSTLERRLAESFQQVSQRLEAVHKGLGEMKALAAGVGDLKEVLTNVKSRGTWGEVQLESLLEQFLTPDQYEKNVATRPDRNHRVEFAIRLPGRVEGGAPVLLPIDAKFPLEDYRRILEAQERSDRDALEESSKRLEKRVLAEAATIREKYVAPPHTTDFAILFLASESLYAEVLRRPGLLEALQTRHRVVIAGPTTIAALLNSLQMGFRTLAIEERSSQVWELLGSVKTEFARFGEALAKVKKKLDEASGSIEDAERRTRVMRKELKSVEDGAPPLVEAGDEPASN